MSKVKVYESQINEILSTENFENMKNYILKNSNLPGPRGNLELAYAFSNCFNENSFTNKLWNFLLILFGQEAETNEPEELLPFCAILAFANLYFIVDENKKNIIFKNIISSMNSPRWRTRESAAMGCQIIAEKDITTIKDWFLSIYPNSNFLEKRAILAALAHPPILKDIETAKYSLSTCEKILEDVVNMDDLQKKNENYIVLKKGLMYAPSVFVSHIPKDGFIMLEKFAHLHRKDINSIIKSNLNKSRLKKYFNDDVQRILKIIENNAKENLK